MNIESGLIGGIATFLCEALKQCEDEKNDEYCGTGSKPTSEWCNQLAPSPPWDPGTTNGQMMGMEKERCAVRKLLQQKRKSKHPLAKDVIPQQRLKVPGGGTCIPDVIVGKPPNCKAVFDFKTSCPLTPEKEGRWHIYNKKTAPNQDWEGRSQKELYAKVCGVDPIKIHLNENVCNRKR